LTLLTPWALLALALLVPLCLSHLRRPPRREVASTLLWRELGATAASRARRLARPAAPLPLLLQAAAVIFTVAALAEPVPPPAPVRPLPVTAAPGTGTPAAAAASGLPLQASDPSASAQPARAGVTIVGTGLATQALTRAFSAMPGLAVRALRPERYRAAGRPGDAGLLVLDHWLPPGGIPASASAVLLVDPPALDGAQSAGALRDPLLSGEDDTSPLLDGVDLTSLSAPAPATTRITGPAWLAPVAWTPSGPLLAAGTGPGMRRLAVLAVDPARTSLPQLPAFPILLRNILGWALAPAPAPPRSATHVPGPGSHHEPPAPAWWRWAVAGSLLALAGEAGYLVVALGLTGAARPRGGRRPGRTRRLLAPRGAFLARLLAFALLAAALAVPGITRPGGGAPLVLADRSGSITGPARSAESAWLAALRRQAPRSRVVTFGAPSGTGIAAAIRFGVAAIGSASGAASPATPRPSRVVLLSDGLATSAGTLAAAQAALAAQVPVDVADIGRAAVPSAAVTPDAAVTRLAAPSAVRAGDTITLPVTVHATVAGQASVVVSRDGRAVTRLAARLGAGDNPLLLSSPSGPPGWRHFRVAVTSPRDSVAANNTLDAVTRVAAPPRLLYAGTGTRAPALLRRLGLDVRALPPSALPRQERGYLDAVAVILDDVPAGALDHAQAAALAAAVRTRGLGLLALGGPHSLDASWYAGTALPAALPVSGTGSGPPGSVSLELALDRSGSMNDLAGNVPKIAMARASALGAITFARAHHDRLGIVSFDVVPRVLAPMRAMTAAAAAAAAAAVTGLTASGGTDIAAALRTAAGQLSSVPGGPGSRQLILMTDGVSQSASYGALARGLRAAGMTLSTVGLGGQVDQELLRQLAAIGGGRYTHTSDAAALPRIFAAAESRTVRPDDVTGPIPVQVTASVPAARSLLGMRLPEIGGLDATALKPRATAVITTGDVISGPAGGSPAKGGAASGGASPGRAGATRYPVLAQWQYGLGRVVAWTPGLTSAGAGDWAGRWAGEAGLWNDTVRWLLPGVPVPALTPRLLDAHPGGAPVVAVDPLANAGATVTAPALRATVAPPRGPAATITLRTAGPSLFAGTLPNAGPGIYRIAISPPGARPGSAGVVTDLAVGYPREYLPSPAGPALLAEVAAVTGGRILIDPASAAAWETARNGTRELALWWPLALLALVVFAAAAVAASPSGLREIQVQGTTISFGPGNLPSPGPPRAMTIPDKQ
jgi:Ca-activated chloride channel family protein